MLWISVHDTLREHPKTYSLAGELGIDQYAAGGIVVFLWTWALTNAPDGNLGPFPDAAIARACFWSKKPGTLVDALIKSGFLDQGKMIHDWGVYAGALIDKEDRRRENDRQRQRDYRARKTSDKPATDADGTEHVTRDCHNHVTRDKSVTNDSVTRDTDVTSHTCHALKNRIDKNREEESIYVTGGGGNNVTNGLTDQPPPPPPTASAYCEIALRGMSTGNYEELKSFLEDGLPDSLIIYAVDDACAHGFRTWAYVAKILNRYVVSGIRTVEQAKAEKQEHERKAAAEKNAKGKPMKRVSAQMYTQRDYTEEELDSIGPNLLEECKMLRDKGLLNDELADAHQADGDTDHQEEQPEDSSA